MPCLVTPEIALSPAFLPADSPRLAHWGFTPAAQPRDDRRKSGAGRSVVEAGPAHAQPSGKIGIGADEVTGDPAEQHRAGPNEHAVEQRERERRAEDDERNRQGETEKNQQ